MTESTLIRAFECLAPVRHELVVVGGAAHRLFPLHSHGRAPGFELLTTEDVDVAAPLHLAHRGGSELLRRLEEAGFDEELRGAERATHVYRPRDRRSEYLQFIAPLTGSGTRRDGTPEPDLRFSGIHAERLRHVDLLLHRPWTASLDSDGAPLDVQVVNPVAFSLQKLLVLPRRGSKRSKDLLYVYDTLVIFSAAVDALGAEAPELARAPAPRTAAKLRRTLAELCFAESDVSREAAAIASSHRRRAPASSEIVAACRLGLPRLLGGIVPGL